MQMDMSARTGPYPQAAAAPHSLAPPVRPDSHPTAFIPGQHQLAVTPFQQQRPHPYLSYGAVEHPTPGNAGTLPMKVSDLLLLRMLWSSGN